MRLECSSWVGASRQSIAASGIAGTVTHQVTTSPSFIPHRLMLQVSLHMHQLCVYSHQPNIRTDRLPKYYSHTRIAYRRCTTEVAEARRRSRPGKPPWFQWSIIVGAMRVSHLPCNAYIQHSRVSRDRSIISTIHESI